jgi:hypothetical protein
MQTYLINTSNLGGKNRAKISTFRSKFKIDGVVSNSSNEVAVKAHLDQKNEKKW